MGSDLPIVLIELVLVFGGALGFGWWQLRSIEKDRQAARRQLEADQAEQAPEAAQASRRPDDAPPPA